MTHALQCRCGTLKGIVANPRDSFRALCYCEDCQAFAYFLQRERDVLDSRGGTGVIQTAPANITLTQGMETIACMRLTPTGLFRWYAACCGTPVGNTMASYRVSFIGLVDTCLREHGKSLEESFGPVRSWVHTNGARGGPKPEAKAMGKMILRFLAVTAKARLSGNYRRNPFFRADTGAPIATPRVLSSAEHAKLMRSVRAASA